MGNGRAARRWVIAVVVTLGGGRAQAQVPDRFTNLEVLPRDISRKELVLLMRGWASSLGVRCGHCHTGGNPDTLEGVDFASDARWEKRTARRMLRMVRALEGDYLGRLEARPVKDGVPVLPAVRVDCVTCHRGLPRPETIETVLARALAAEGTAGAVRTYEELRVKHLGRGSYDFSEGPVNTLAEQLLHEDRARDAVVLLEMSAEFNPEAAWLRHLLGEARLAAGDRVGALQSFDRALALNPQNTLTRKRVEELEAAPGPRP